MDAKVIRRRPRQFSPSKLKKIRGNDTPQLFVAKLFAVTGYLTHATMVPKYEAGRHRPGSAFVAAVAAYAGEPIDAFFD